MMSEVQENVLDDQNPDYTDLESLLAVANSSEFSISNGFTEEKQEFEKLNSFFEILTANDSNNLNNESRYSMPLFLHPRDDDQLSENYTAGSYLRERLLEIGLKN